MLATVVAAAYGLWRLLRPSRPRFLPPGPDDLRDAKAVIADGRTASANLALLGDKRLMFNSDRTAFIMYQESGSSWVAMGDPVGRADQCELLAWDFWNIATAWRCRRCSTRWRPTTCPCTSTSG